MRRVHDRVEKREAKDVVDISVVKPTPGLDRDERNRTNRGKTKPSDGVVEGVSKNPTKLSKARSRNSVGYDVVKVPPR